jgi:hypothetical protein
MKLNNGVEWYPTEEEIKMWSELYPAVDIEQELRNMTGWLYSNPQRRKTSRGILRFCNTWLQKAQQRGDNRRKPTSTRETSLHDDLTDTSWAL